MTEGIGRTDVATATVAAKVPTKRELRKLTAPFLAKEVDFDNLRQGLSDIKQTIHDHPETAGFIADRLGFNELIGSDESGHEYLQLPLNRDPRNLFERMAINEEGGYYPGTLSALLAIVSNGMERPRAEMVLKSIFDPEAHYNFETLGVALKSNSHIPALAIMPSWLKDFMAPYQLQQQATPRQ